MSTSLDLLNWFHVFPDRPSIADVIDVLRTGPTPRLIGATAINETALAISPPRVYAYLGRAHEAFGTWAFAIALSAFQGEVSPFDTGGLVAKIAPCSSWTAAARQKFLGDLSFPSSAIMACLSQYPVGDVGVVSYLRRQRPRAAGPHAFWPAAQATSMWHQNNDPRAWTWEGRAPVRLPTGRLVAWTCPAKRYAEVRRHAENSAPADESWYEALFDCHVHGGLESLQRKYSA